MSRLLALLLAAFASGCTVDVLLGSEDGCDRGTAETWTEPDAEGCSRDCVCGTDGTPTCGPSYDCPPPVPIPMPLGCDWPEEGVVLAPQDTKLSADSCTSCTCQDNGTLSCAQDPCCSAPPQGMCEATDPLSGCYSTPLCGSAGWECSELSCDCQNQLPPYCPEPPPESGCYWMGPDCGADGFYTCGTLVCPSCDTWNTCGDPMIPGCVYEPRCDQGIIPTCELVCNTCPDPPIQCMPSGPDCTSTPICGPMGWDCDEQCPVPCDPTALGTGMCDYDNPGCRGGGPVCLENNWYCADVCGM